MYITWFRVLQEIITLESWGQEGKKDHGEQPAVHLCNALNKYCYILASLWFVYNLECRKSHLQSFKTNLICSYCQNFKYGLQKTIYEKDFCKHTPCSRQIGKVKGVETSEHKIMTLEISYLMTVEDWKWNSEELKLLVNKPDGFRLWVTRRGCGRRLHKIKKAEVLWRRIREHIHTGSWEVLMKTTSSPGSLPKLSQPPNFFRLTNCSVSKRLLPSPFFLPI